MRTLEEKRIDGLLVMSAHSAPGFFEMLSERCQWPLLILDSPAPGLEADVIMEDPEQGGYEATRHLLEKGHHVHFRPGVTGFRMIYP